MANQPCFDIIGDVHGRYQTLINLLETLGYQQIDDIWQKPGHKAVFVGDLIDKGENPAGVLRLVRAMVEAGHAQMVVGNHELNWVRDAHAFQQTPSQFVQATRQHHDRRRLVEAFAAEEQGLEDLLAHFQWLREQPLYLELEDCRVVHAWWHEASIHHLKAMGLRCLDDATMAAYEDTYSSTYFALDRVVAGCEHTMRAQASRSAFRTNRRRVRWWPKDVALIHSAEMVPSLAREVGYSRSSAPVFFGHYAMTGTPVRLGPNVACLDYAAAYHGVLMAYTHKPGTPLQSSNFTWVDVQEAAATA